MTVWYVPLCWFNFFSFSVFVLMNMLLSCLDTFYKFSLLFGSILFVMIHGHLYCYCLQSSAERVKAKMKLQLSEIGKHIDLQGINHPYLNTFSPYVLKWTIFLDVSNNDVWCTNLECSENLSCSQLVWEWNDYVHITWKTWFLAQILAMPSLVFL